MHSRDPRASADFLAITPALRAKIFGHNTAKVYGLSEVKRYISRDALSRSRAAYLHGALRDHSRRGKPRDPPW